jgi:acyl-ACP thioesterase
VNARPAVGSHGCEERQSEAVLVEECTTGAGELGRGGFEVGPTGHYPIVTVGLPGPSVLASGIGYATTVTATPPLGATVRACHDEAVDSEFVACPPDGRRVVRSRTVRLGDVAPSGRLRLDALARYLQDVAADDVDDAGITGAWVLRRCALRIGDLPRFRERVELDTFCSGFGRRWAERRTTVLVDGAPRVESVAVWVYVDERGRPAPLEDWFFDLYGTAANDRRVSGRLRLPAPPEEVLRRPWVLRRTDLDVLGHVNNAIAWAAVEDEVAGDGAFPGGEMSTAEMEYRAPVDVGEVCELLSAPTADGMACWLVTGGEVRAAARVARRSGAPAA